MALPSDQASEDRHIIYCGGSKNGDRCRNIIGTRVAGKIVISRLGRQAGLELIVNEIESMRCPNCGSHLSVSPVPATPVMEVLHRHLAQEQPA